MRVLHINTLYTGGAANACFRLHQALLNEGVESDVLVLNAKSKLDIPRVHIYQENKFWNKQLFLGNRIPRELQRRWKEVQLTGIESPKHKFNLPSAWYSLHKHPLVQAADVINLHWVNQFVDYQSFFKNVNKPIFWTLHDMTPFTGGCDYSFGCEHFMSACGICWFTQNARKPRWPEEILSQKKKALQSSAANLQIIALSDWMKANSERSALFGEFPHHLIPNSLDIEVFKPNNQQEARKRLGLPQNKKIGNYSGCLIIKNKINSLNLMYG